MKLPVILDTGPLVAILDRRDRYHSWAAGQTARMVQPMFTCEPVLTEAYHLVRHDQNMRLAILQLIKKQVLRITFSLEEHHEAVNVLLARYADVPMSLADACLVRMSELIPESTVFTLDTDFHVYRRHRRQKIPLLIPPDRL